MISLTNPLSYKDIIAADGRHTCSINNKNQPSCWGQNEWKNTAPIPKDIQGTATTVETGSCHSCAINIHKHVFCWGENKQSQIDVPVYLTKEYAKLTSVKQNGAVGLALGGQHSCAILESKRLTCFGVSFDFQGGIPKENMTEIVMIKSRNETLCLLKETTLTSHSLFHNLYHLGHTHNTNKSPVLTNPDYSTILKCFGPNSSGQNDIPGNVIHTSEFSVGMQHVCGVKDSIVQCWGDDSFKQTQVPFSKYLRPYAIFVSAGWIHTCIIMPGSILCVGGVKEIREVPMDLKTSFYQVASGSDHVCGLTVDKNIQCFGNNQQKQLDKPRDI